MATLTDLELAEKLRGPKMIAALNRTGQTWIHEAANRLESRAEAYQILARAFRVSYAQDGADNARGDVETYSPLTVTLAGILTADETSEASMDYAALNVVLSWLGGREAMAS